MYPTPPLSPPPPPTKHCEYIFGYSITHFEKECKKFIEKGYKIKNVVGNKGTWYAKAVKYEYEKS